MFVHLLSGHGGLLDVAARKFPIPEGSSVTFLCGPGGTIGGGVSKAVMDCIANKQDLSALLRLIKPVGVEVSRTEYTATLNPKKVLPETAASYPKTKPAGKSIRDYVLGEDEGKFEMVTYEDGNYKATTDWKGSLPLSISGVFDICRVKGWLPAHVIWIACREHPGGSNPRCEDVAWVTPEELTELLEGETKL